MLIALVQVVAPATWGTSSRLTYPGAGDCWFAGLATPLTETVTVAVPLLVTVIAADPLQLNRMKVPPPGFGESDDGVAVRFVHPAVRVGAAATLTTGKFWVIILRAIATPMIAAMAMIP